MNEPLSLLDWGLYRYENWLSKTIIIPGTGMWVVNYDWEKNRINIVCRAGKGNEYLDIEMAKLGCKQIVGFIRGNSPVDVLSEFFSHTTFAREQAPQNIGSQLYTIISIKIFASYNKKANLLKCVAPLQGSEIYFEE